MEGKRRGKKKRVRDRMGGIWMARWHRMEWKRMKGKDGKGQDGKGQGGKEQH